MIHYPFLPLYLWRLRIEISAIYAIFGLQWQRLRIIFCQRRLSVATKRPFTISAADGQSLQCRALELYDSAPIYAEGLIEPMSRVLSRQKTFSEDALTRTFRDDADVSRFFDLSGL